MGDNICHECKKKRPTFAAARESLIAYLSTEGWEVHLRDRNFKVLKVPHVTRRDGLRFWFKPQAVWKSNGTSLNEARSTHDDIRDFTPEEFVSRNAR